MKVNTYLGQKGYTIPKNELTIEQQKQIRNDLTIKPFVMGSPMNNSDGMKTFPAYRESSNKFYVPHYYGVAKYGPPKNYKVTERIDIELEFKLETSYRLLLICFSLLQDEPIITII
jgi:hypothetical protein